ncbi:MAG: hypothetical protein Q9165_003719 [Trypethelium subeluteriae]
MDGQTFKATGKGQTQLLNVQDWINSIEKGDVPDRLSRLDELVDSSIGGLKEQMENVMGTQDLVPLFEFRNLGSVTVEDGTISSRVVSIEQAIMNYHKDYANGKGLPRRSVNQTVI